MPGRPTKWVKTIHDYIKLDRITSLAQLSCPLGPACGQLEQQQECLRVRIRLAFQWNVEFSVLMSERPGLGPFPPLPGSKFGRRQLYCMFCRSRVTLILCPGLPVALGPGPGPGAAGTVAPLEASGWKEYLLLTESCWQIVSYGPERAEA